MRLFALLACTLMVAGCAHRRPMPSASATAVPVAARPAPPVGMVDGAYSGPSRLILADGRGCPRSTVVDATVFDRGFDIPYREGPGPLQPVHATIGPDNTINGGDGIVTIAGRLEGDAVLNLSVANLHCQSHVVLRRH